MTDKMIDNRVKKLQALEAKQAALGQEADAIFEHAAKLERLCELLKILDYSLLQCAEGLEGSISDNQYKELRNCTTLAKIAVDVIELREKELDAIL